FLRRLAAETRHGADLFQRRHSQALHGTEFFQQRRLAPLADAGEFVQHALGNFFEPQLRVVAVGHAMTFVAQALQQFHRRMIQAEPERLAFLRQINFLKLLRQSDDRDAFETKFFQLGARHAQLAFAAVNHDQVWKRHRTGVAPVSISVFCFFLGRSLRQERRLSYALFQPRIPPAHHFRHARKIILTGDGLDFEAPVIRAVGPAIFETDQRCHGERAADVGNIKTLDALRRRGQAEDSCEFHQIACRIDGERPIVRHTRELFSFLPGVLQVADEVAQVGGFFKLVRGGGLFLFRLELALPFPKVAFEKIARGVDLFEILLAGDIADARGGAMFQVRVETMLVIRLARREHATAAQVELFPRERDGVAQRQGIHERTEVARAVVFLQPREDEIRNRVVQVHLEHQVALVVAQADVETRLEILDELAFEQQRLRFAAHDVDIEIRDGLDQRVEFQVPAHPPAGLKILAHALPQIERLADIDDRAEAVLVQIYAGLVRDGAQFFTNVFRRGHAQKFHAKMPGRKGILTEEKRLPWKSNQRIHGETKERKTMSDKIPL